MDDDRDILQQSVDMEIEIRTAINTGRGFVDNIPLASCLLDALKTIQSSLGMHNDLMEFMADKITEKQLIWRMTKWPVGFRPQDRNIPIVETEEEMLDRAINHIESMDMDYMAKRAKAMMEIASKVLPGDRDDAPAD